MKLLNGKKISTENVVAIIYLVQLYRLLSIDQIIKILKNTTHRYASDIRSYVLYKKVSTYNEMCPACNTADSCDDCFLKIIDKFANDTSVVAPCINQKTYPYLQSTAVDIFKAFNRRAKFLENKLNKLVPNKKLVNLTKKSIKKIKKISKNT